jgi:hypothetical protein
MLISVNSNAFEKKGKKQPLNIIRKIVDKLTPMTKLTENTT